MKVNELLSSLFVGGSAASQRSGAEAGSQVRGGPVASAESGAGDAVKLEAGLSSGTANDVSREARIAELKAQIENGSYRIDSARLAEAVARELL